MRGYINIIEPLVFVEVPAPPKLVPPKPKMLPLLPPPPKLLLLPPPLETEVLFPCAPPDVGLPEENNLFVLYVKN